MTMPGPGGSASFIRFIAEHDCPCPVCGYNLRGLNEPTCPECGLRAGWGAYSFWSPDSSPSAFRAIDGLVLVGGALSVFLLACRAPTTISEQDEIGIAAAVLLPVVFLGCAWLWISHRRAAAKWRGHTQRRWVSGVALALFLYMVFAMEARVI